MKKCPCCNKRLTKDEKTMGTCYDCDIPICEEED